MLKVLYLPLNDASNVQQSTYNAFNEVGVQLEICDFHNVWLQTKNIELVAKDFIDKVTTFQPNLIHMQLQFTGLLSAQTINMARKICPNVVITNWTGDCRAVAQREFVDVGKAVDYSLISSTGHLDLYRAAGLTNTRYWQIGYDPKANFPMNRDTFKYDIAFIANNYGNTFPDGKIRSDAAETLQKIYGSRFGLFGSGYGQFITGLESSRMNEVYNNSACTLSISNFNSVSHYFSDRLLYCLASGRPTIAWRFPGCESYFLDGKEIIYVNSNQQILDAVKFCISNPDEATRIGQLGAQRVAKEHSFVSRIIELLSLTNTLNLL